MNEEESMLVDAFTSYMELSISSMAIYLTLVTGYLVVAYFAARELSLKQLVISSTLFIFASSVAAFSSYRYAFIGMKYAARLTELGAPNQSDFLQPGVYLYGSILFAGIVAALYFMWSTRSSTIEQDST